jgi:hypothetical protein
MVGESDTSKLERNKYHEPLVKIYAKDDRSDWDGT